MLFMSLIVAAALALQAGGAPEIEISNFVGEVVIENGATLSVRVERSAGNEPVDVTETANRLVIDGGQSLRRWGCYGRRDERRVGRNRSSSKPFEDYPRLVISMPEPADLNVERSIISGTTDDLSALDLSARCVGRYFVFF